MNNFPCLGCKYCICNVDAMTDCTQYIEKEAEEEKDDYPAIFAMDSLVPRLSLLRAFNYYV